MSSELFLEEPSIEDRLKEVQTRRLHPFFFESELRDLLKEEAAFGLLLKESRTKEHYDCAVSHEKLHLALQDCLGKLQAAAETESVQAHKLRHMQKDLDEAQETVSKLRNELLQQQYSVDRIINAVDQSHKNLSVVLEQNRRFGVPPAGLPAGLPVDLGGAG